MNKALLLLTFLALLTQISPAAADPHSDTCDRMYSRIEFYQDTYVTPCGTCLDAFSYFVANPSDEETVFTNACGVGVDVSLHSWPDASYALDVWLDTYCVQSWQTLQAVSAFYTQHCL